MEVPGRALAFPDLENMYSGMNTSHLSDVTANQRDTQWVSNALKSITLKLWKMTRR